MKKIDYIQPFLPKKLSPLETASAYAPANIALSKYWGKRDIELNLPANGSLSISLGTLGTHTQITLSDKDSLMLNGENIQPNTPFFQKTFAFIDLFRQQQNFPIAITTKNTIPTAAGLASSASGYAALTLALNQFLQLNLSPFILSTFARIGSGSASRSLWHGFVKWQKGDKTDGSDSAGIPIDSQWQTLRIALIEIDTRAKSTTSTNGMTHTANTSPLYPAWINTAEKDLQTIENAIKNQNFQTLGQTAEGNALAMHATMLAARPALSYFQPTTQETIQEIWKNRAEGLNHYFTMDAGPNIKILYQIQDETDILNCYPNAKIVNPFLT